MVTKNQKNTSQGKSGLPAGADKYVSVKKAAAMVGVTPESIRLWVRRGLLPAKKFRVVQLHSMVLRSSLDSVRTVACLHCGKPFQAKRPQKARFCSAKHRDQWNYLNKKAKTVKTRR